MWAEWSSVGFDREQHEHEHYYCEMINREHIGLEQNGCEQNGREQDLTMSNVTMSITTVIKFNVSKSLCTCVLFESEWLSMWASPWDCRCEWIDYELVTMSKSTVSVCDVSMRDSCHYEHYSENADVSGIIVRCFTMSNSIVSMCVVSMW